MHPHHSIDASTTFCECDQDNYTPLMAAADRGHVDCVKVLIANKANINAAAKVHGWVW